MSFEHKLNRGNLFVNIGKKESKHPDRKGQINVNGMLFDIAGWIATTEDGEYKMDKNGKPYLQLKISEPFKKKTEQPTDYDEEKPF